MKYYIIAGEASGDLHGSNLVKELKALDSTAQFTGWGGDEMESNGVNLVKHYKEVAFMGFIEVIQHLPTILGALSDCKKDILNENPDALILIDYPGFNLRIAKWAKKEGIKVFYYISPQVWAWKESRVKQMKENIDHLIVILPFEKPFFDKHKMESTYVGHPLLDAIDPQSFKKAVDTDKPVIALLPGSRKQEVSKTLPVMNQLMSRFVDYEFVIGGAPALNKSFYKNIVGDRIKVVHGKTQELMHQAEAAIVASGTATLETAIIGTPQVVGFKGNILSYWIARFLVRNIRFISLVNLIMDEEVVKELIQNDFNKNNLEEELSALLENKEAKAKMKEKYLLLKEKLGGKGASKRTAEFIHQKLTDA